MRELAEWRDSRRINSSLRTPDVPSNGQLVIDYLEWCKTARNRSPQTLRSYTTTLAAWVEWCAATPMLTMDRSAMEAFTQRKRERRGKGRMGSPATRKRECSCLRAFYQWAVEAGYLFESPAKSLHGPTVRNVNPRPVEDDVWLQVWKADVPDNERLALGLGYFFGLRRYEIVTLTGDQITNTRIRDFTRKGGGEHVLPWAEMYGVYLDELPQLCGEEDLLPRLLREAAHRAGEGQLLPWHTTDPQAFNKRLYRLQQRLDMPEDQWFTPHQLRHSCATNLLRAGVPLHMVAALMNHSNPSITMRYVKAGGRELAEWRKRQAVTE